MDKTANVFKHCSEEVIYLGITIPHLPFDKFKVHKTNRFRPTFEICGQNLFFSSNPLCQTEKEISLVLH